MCRIVPAALCALAVVCPSASPAEDRPRTRVYTNEDLDRVAPLRGQTGVLSRPGAQSAAPAAPSLRDAPGRGEAWWRAEARRVGQEAGKLRRRASALRRRIAAAEEAAFRGRRPTTGATSHPAAGTRAELIEVEDDLRRLESDLADRARRAGALPGWLR